MTTGNGPSRDPRSLVENQPCPDCGVSLAPPPQEHADGCLVWSLFARLGRKDAENERLRKGLHDLRRELLMGGAWDEGSWADNHVRALLGEVAP